MNHGQKKEWSFSVFLKRELDPSQVAVLDMSLKDVAHWIWGTPETRTISFKLHFPIHQACIVLYDFPFCKAGG